MKNRLQNRLRWVVALACLLQASARADEIMCDGPPPSCGKVCKLVCDTKKLTSVCYGCSCKDICIPDASRQGCKHCAVCYGKDSGDCRNTPPKCQFCWRDWFACGCAQSRTIHTLTKYQAEKEICWYHWEVVDAGCCDCVTKNASARNTNQQVAKQSRRTIYKPAPEGAEIGAVLPVSEEEWVKLAAVLAPDPTEVSEGAVTNATAKPEGQPTSEGKALGAGSKTPTVAERFQRLIK